MILLLLFPFVPSSQEGTVCTEVYLTAKLFAQLWLALFQPTKSTTTAQ
jgi:hypothetical protein